MFGVGVQEAIIIGLLFLVVFGPGKLPGMARDFGRFVSEARRHVGEFKSELASTDNDSSNRTPHNDRPDVGQR